MSLRAIQEQMQAAIMGPPVQDERLAIYQRAYRLRLVETLHGMFPRLLRALGEPLFNDFALEFIRSDPPRGWTLARLAETFPQFLDETKPDEPWAHRLADLARREGTFRSRLTAAATGAAAMDSGDGGRRTP
jgi:hypothetical protein